MAEKIAPVQGYARGIPWEMHMRAYDAYSKKWAPQPAMIDLEGRNCRGGFSVGELDEFIPGWREELSERGKTRAALAEIADMPYSMVNDADSLRHTIKTMQSIARNILNSEAK